MPLQRTWIAVTAGSASAILVALGIMSALDAAAIARPRLGLDIIDSVSARLAHVSHTDPENRVLVLGDSTALSGAPGGHLDRRLGQAIASVTRNGDRAIEPTPLLYPGLDPFNYYALVDEIAATRPRLAILAFGLAQLSPVRGRHYTELAGWIAPSRLGNALGLPLEHYGLTVDRLLLYIGLVHGGMVDVWRVVRSEQARVGQAWEQLQDGFTLAEEPGAMTRLKTTLALARLGQWTQKGNLRRFNRAGAMRSFEAALHGGASDHPALRLLETTIALFTRLGIATLVYIVPVNVEHLETLGIDTTAFGPAITTVDTRVRAAGGLLVDLHRLLPDDSFRDATHFDVPGEKNGVGLVAEALAPHVLAILRSDNDSR